MDYSKLLDSHYKAYLQESDLMTLFFQGEAGIGKTQLIKDYCKENNLELVIMNLSAIDASDLTGIPYIENGIQKYSRPEFLNVKKGLIFFDEINRVNDHDVKSALLSLLQDKKINGHALHREAMIVTAGNTSSEDYDVNEFDSAMQGKKGRLMTVKFERTFTEFFKYLESKHERSNLLDFYKLHSDSVREFSFRRLEQALNYIENGGMIEALNYSLSPSVFTLYAEYLNKNLFNFQDLLEGKIKKELDSSAEKKLLFDLKDALKNDFEFSEKQAKQVNKFLNEVRAENKQLFFRDLQELALNDNTFDAKKIKWKKLELFKGLKEFLDLYLK